MPETNETSKASTGSIIPIRFSPEALGEILIVARDTELNRTDVIRQAVRLGLPLVRQRWANGEQKEKV